MPKLKRLSGQAVIKILSQFDFQVASQRGSHVKLRRIAPGGTQTLTIPSHKEIDRGTLAAIYNQASRYIDASELKNHFYTK
jgi:predicted RNA binding protein YcfA (HicA-like mRNA interferase family)